MAFTGQAGAVEIITMALIQTVRNIYPLRGLYHQWMVRQWLGRAIPARPSARRPSRANLARRALAYRQLISLANGGHEGWRFELELFDLPIETLCGQIGAVAEQALDLPRRYRHLLSGLAGADRSRSATHLANYMPPKNDGVDVEYVNRRNELTQRIRRNIEGFQISSGLLWRRVIRLSAILISAALSISPAYSETAGLNTQQRWAFILLTGLVGGFTAWIARDVLAIVERLRK